MAHVTFGLKNVVYSLITDSDGILKYGNVKKLEGAQEISIDALGSLTNVYADDILYATAYNKVGANITLKVTDISDEFKIDVLGYQKSKNGNLVEMVKNIPQPFALGYEIQGDEKNRRIWFVYCVASPLSESSKSKADSIEANSLTLNITACMVVKGENQIIKTVANTYDDNYATYLSVPPAIEKDYIWNPSTSENDCDIVSLSSSLTSVSGYNYDGIYFSKGFKLSSSSKISLEIPESNAGVTIEVVGYSNSTSNEGKLLLTDLTTNLGTTSSDTFGLKSETSLRSIKFSLKPKCKYSLSKSNAESVICYIKTTVNII